MKETFLTLLYTAGHIMTELEQSASWLLVVILLATNDTLIKQTVTGPVFYTEKPRNSPLNAPLSSSGEVQTAC